MRRKLSAAALVAAVLSSCGEPILVSMEPGDQVLIKVEDEHSSRLKSVTLLQADQDGVLRIVKAGIPLP